MTRGIVTLLAFLMAGGVALAEDGSDSFIPELAGLALSLLPVGSMKALLVVFPAIAALNAISIGLEYVTKRTESEMDDKAVSTFRSGLAKVQKVLNFFIAKR